MDSKMRKILEVEDNPYASEEDLRTAFKYLTEKYVQVITEYNAIFDYAKLLHQDNELLRKELKKPSFKDELQMH